MKQGEENMIFKSWTFFFFHIWGLFDYSSVGLLLSLEKIQKDAWSSLYNLTFYYIFIKIVFIAHAHFYKL